MTCLELKNIVNSIPSECLHYCVDISDVVNPLQGFSFCLKKDHVNRKVKITQKLPKKKLYELKRLQEIEKLTSCWQPDVINNLGVIKQ